MLVVPPAYPAIKNQEVSDSVAKGRDSSSQLVNLE